MLIDLMLKIYLKIKKVRL